LIVDLERLRDAPGDCWSGLREAWDEVATGETVRVLLGRSGLSRSDACALLTLAGFTPGAWTEEEGGAIVQATKQARAEQPLSCSIIVPCRNEVGNVDALVRRVPAVGTHTQLIFVDGASTDGTPERIEELIRDHPERDISLLRQTGEGGKAGAVFQGFDAAQGDILMILDADMTVAPEDLPRFHLALAEGVADFANGTRFTYPMDDRAMRPLNAVGNRVFSAFFSWVLGTRVTDTLCGTKAIFRRDWLALRSARPLFGGHDPWGDFDLLLGAAYCGLRIVDVPVRYHARVAGESKMRPLRHGSILARTCLAGFYRLKLRRGEREESV
jgi:glycosyltransferase involved in cell wall biosynthesis